MISSPYILHLMSLLLDGDAEGVFAKNQMDFLEIIDLKYTGMGVFVSFSHTSGAEKFRMANHNLVLDGVEIKSPELAAQANAILFFKEGIVDYLEIWSCDSFYPEKELEAYSLKQTWIGSPGQEITVIKQII
jgi:hypothetical protein